MKISFVPKNDIPVDPVNRMRCYNVIKGLTNLGCKAAIYKGERDYNILVVLSLEFDKWLPIARENKRNGRLTIFDLSDNEFERAANITMSKIIGIRKYILYPKELYIRWQFYKKRKVFDKGLYAFSREADLITVSSKSIYDSVVPINPNCCVIPDAIDLDIYKGGKLHQDKDEIYIVWVGMPNNVIFLQQLNSVFCRLQREFNLKVRIITSSLVNTLFPSLEKKLKFKFEFIEWDLSTINERLMEADIGISPLEGALWKSANKIAVYWAVGLPVVVSPSPEYERVVTQGENGYIARSAGDWYKFLKELIMNSRLRSELGLKGRDYTEMNFSIQNVAKCWLRLFEGLKRGTN